MFLVLNVIACSGACGSDPGSVSALPLGKSMPPSTAMIVRGPIRGGGNGMFTAYVGGLARNHICSGSNTSRSAAPSADRFKLC